MRAVTLTDLSLDAFTLTDRVAELKRDYFRALPEVCTERATLVTRVSDERGLLGRDRITSLDKARLYRTVLERRMPVVRHRQAVDKERRVFEVRDRSLFAGSTTSKLKGVPLYPEFMALALWPELQTLSSRRANPYAITDEQVRVLNEEVFPHWLDHNIQEIARKHLAEARGKKNQTGDAPEIKLLEHLVFFLVSKPNCVSHTIPDFSRAVRLGLRAMVVEAGDRAQAEKDETRRNFYLALAHGMEGIIAYSRNLAREARRLAEHEADATERRELLALADIHDHVPEHPARNFREGLTTVWMCWVALHLENANVGLSLGRLDQLLYPLYREDVETGALDVGFAIELLCCLWLKIGDHVPTVPNAGEQLFGGSGSNQAITLGGVDEQGHDAVNDLTYVMLRATELLRLRDPNLNARYHPGVNARQYLRRLCEVNVNTGATPALHNDKAVIAALTAKGETMQQARDYGIVGCVEPASNGRCYGHSGAILLNLISALELAMFDGRHRHTGLDRLIGEPTGAPDSFPSFESFRRAFARQTAWLVDKATSLNNTFGRVHQDVYPTPLLSALFEGPMGKGQDLVFGGATLNASGAAIVGFADVVDSLAAIEHVVFDEHALSLGGLLTALQCDYEGYEVLRTRLRNQDKTPKYGNENPKADAIARWLAELLDELFANTRNYRGGHYRVGYWTMTNHAGFGRLSPSSPNGRRAGENFTSGITPVSGVTPYLTKALHSVANLPSRLLSNGVALNLKYTPESDTARLLDNFVASVEAYFDAAPGRHDGGMEIQFNVASHDTFVDAAARPHAHPELLVRVSGYTAYFKDLNPQMQQEIIERTEYDLRTGHAVEIAAERAANSPHDT